jgi:hypothetical protein
VELTPRTPSSTLIRALKEATRDLEHHVKQISDEVGIVPELLHGPNADRATDGANPSQSLASGPGVVEEEHRFPGSLGNPAQDCLRPRRINCVRPTCLRWPPTRHEFSRDPG